MIDINIYHLPEKEKQEGEQKDGRVQGKEIIH